MYSQDDQLVAGATSDVWTATEDRFPSSPLMLATVPGSRVAWTADDDLYATLCVAPGADTATITAAYRRLVRHHHPDLSTANDATDRLRELNAAYAVLRNPKTRLAYDIARGYVVVVPPALKPTLRQRWAAVVRWLREPVTLGRWPTRDQRMST